MTRLPLMATDLRLGFTTGSTFLRESPSRLGETGQPVRLPCSRCAWLEDLPNVEERAAGVDAWHRSRNRVVRLVALRRRDALEDSGWRARSVAAHGQDACAPVRERDLEDRCSVGPPAAADVVDEADVCLEIGELPADEPRDPIGAAAAARGRPGAASGRGRGASTARGRDKM